MPDPFGSNANKVTIKGGKTSRSQRQILARALRYADKHNAPYRAKQALIAALIVESEAKNLSTPSADGYGSYGVLQGLESHYGKKKLMNPEFQFGVFLGKEKNTDGRYTGFTGKGNAIELAKRGMNPGAIAQAVEGSAYPDRYGQVMNEANKIIKLYRGGGGGLNPPKVDKGTGGTPNKVAAVASNDPADSLSTLLSYTRKRKEGRSVKDLATALVSDTTVDTTPTAPSAPKMPTAPSKPKKSGSGRPGQIYEMFYDPGFSWDSGSRSGPIGGHSDHVHLAADRRRVEYLGKVAQRMGLSVGEQDKFGGRPSGGHATGSFHYKGQAIDVSGDPAKMKAFNRYVKKAYKLR